MIRKPCCSRFSLHKFFHLSIFLDPIQKRAPARSVQLKAVYTKALLQCHAIDLTEKTNQLCSNFEKKYIPIWNNLISISFLSVHSWFNVKCLVYFGNSISCYDWTKYFHFVLVRSLGYIGIFGCIWYYSKASRYTASSCTDLAGARFWIGSKNIWDARFCTFLHVFLINEYLRCTFLMNEYLRCTFLHVFTCFCMFFARFLVHEYLRYTIHL
jgi:hypothetical protein